MDINPSFSQCTYLQLLDINDINDCEESVHNQNLHAHACKICTKIFQKISISSSYVNISNLQNFLKTHFKIHHNNREQVLHGASISNVNSTDTKYGGTDVNNIKKKCKNPKKYKKYIQKSSKNLKKK